MNYMLYALVHLLRLNISVTLPREGAPSLKLCPSTAWGRGLIPGQRTKIPHVMWSKKKTQLGRCDIQTMLLKIM